MIEKVQTLWPEITLLVGACVVMILGLSRTAFARRMCSLVAGGALVAAGVLAYKTTPDSHNMLEHLPRFGKVLTAAVGLILLLVVAGTADREYETKVERGATFDPLNATRGEFYAFFLFSLTGLMLCCGSDDLVWLFLALELVSLPTYIMVTISTAGNKSMEAGVKYFFLGALGAAVFLYGFALIYGATGSTNFVEITRQFKMQAMSGGGINVIGLLGVILALIGIAFKIAAAPMHMYAADVYQGASSSVAAFLAFVPKTAGFIAILALVSTLGWEKSAEYPGGSLPVSVHSVLWAMAAATMTIGNVLALLQKSVKRMLAYSSVAHSGYMLVGVIAGPGVGKDATLTGSGIAAVLFYLIAYGVMNVGTFAVLACLQRPGKDGQMEEADSIDDIKGLCATRPLLGWTMVICSMSLLGLPPLLGFFGKVPLFSSGLAGGHYTLVIVLGLNSAIAAVYYLRLASAALLEQGDLSGRQGGGVQLVPVPARVLAGVVSAACVIALVMYPVSSAAVYGAAVKKAPGMAEPQAAIVDQVAQGQLVK